MAGFNGNTSTFQPDAPGQKLRTHQSQVGSAPAYEYDPPPPFTNEALNNWEKDRAQWTKPKSGYKKQHKRPVLSVDITYEELLMTNKPFVQPISLTEMVEFLVDCWEQEGLYD